MVVSELRGEKIDIIPYNDEPARFVAKALSPARVREVLVDDEAKQATVIVPDDQLSLAIGREGQNARLAARLTGWRIDIRSETDFATRSEGDGVRGGGGSAAAAPRSSATAGAARTPRCPARATAACAAHQALGGARDTEAARSGWPPSVTRMSADARSPGVPDRERVPAWAAERPAVDARFANVDGRVVPDPAATLPGRGAWLHPSRPASTGRRSPRLRRAPSRPRPGHSDTVDLIHTWQRSASTS